nr:hypothetical protein [Tanacetum cinerariifolium]
EVKNIVEQPTKRRTRISESLQNFRVKKSSTSLNNTSQISSVNAIIPVLPTEEPEYSLSMGYEHLNTIPKMESDEVIESSVKNLIPIPSEYEVTSDDESECDVPIMDESSLVFTTFSTPLFDDNGDFTSSDDELLFDEDFDYLEEFSGELMPTSIVNEECIRREHEEYISLMEKLLANNSFPRSMENFHANTIVETLPPSSILIEDIDSLREEIDIFTCTNDLLPPSTFDHHDDSSFPRPPSEPPYVEFSFNLEPNLGEVILDELIENEYFDP